MFPVTDRQDVSRLSAAAAVCRCNCTLLIMVVWRLCPYTVIACLLREDFLSLWVEEFIILPFYLVSSRW